MTEPGPLLARGRECDVFALDDDRVLRRSRRQHSLEREARVMRFARDHAYPAPEVLDVVEGGRALVLERLHGRSMLDEAGRRPWTLRRAGALLADLHDALHRLPGPDWLPQAPDGGDRLLHGDLHPLNVLLTDSGPVVIDWSNAFRGDPTSEVAHTWALLATSEVPPSLMAPLLSAGRWLFVAGFLARYDLEAARDRLALVVEHRLLDENVTDRERARLRSFLRRESGEGESGEAPAPD